VRKLINSIFGKWSIYEIGGLVSVCIVAILAGMLSGPVHEWFEKTIPCTSTNPLSPINPAIVNGVLKSSYMIFMTVLLFLTFVFSKETTHKSKLWMALLFVVALPLIGYQYSSGYQKIERVSATDVDTVRFNQRWCERRSEKS